MITYTQELQYDAKQLFNKDNFDDILVDAISFYIECGLQLKNGKTICAVDNPLPKYKILK